MVNRYDKYENAIYVAISPRQNMKIRCATRSRRSRALIILAYKHVLVKSGLPYYLGYCAIMVVPEMGGKACEKSLARVVEDPDSIHAHPRPRS
jgi:hypothetical protein